MPSTPAPAPQPSSARGRLTVTDRAAARLLSRTVHDASADLAGHGPPTVRIRHRRGGPEATVRLTASYPAPLPDALAAARRSTHLATRALPGQRPLLRRVEIAALEIADTAPPPGTDPHEDEPPTPADASACAAAPAGRRRRRPRRWTARRPAAALLYTLVAAACALWWYKQRTGTRPLPRLEAAAHWAGHGTAGQATVTAAAALLERARPVAVVEPLLAVVAEAQHSTGLPLPTRLHLTPPPRRRAGHRTRPGT